MRKKNFFRMEAVVGLIILLMAFVIGIINPAAWSANTIFNMLRSMIVPGIFAMGVLMVLISGGMDVSFTYIAPVAAYTTVIILGNIGYNGTVFVPLFIAALIGTFLGMINGVIISKYDFPTLIVTLGTGTAFHGLAVCFIGSAHITNLPGRMIELSKRNLLTLHYADGSKSGIHIGILITIAAVILVWFLLNKTMWGRGLYAIGGSKSAAESIGYPVKTIQIQLYALVGALSGIAGIVFMSLNRQANPHLMVGTELDVIAAVVLGGISVTGGKGTVLGAVLGVVLITILNNSLILVGIPSQWQKAIIGIVILIGTSLPILLARLEKRKAGKVWG